MKINILCYHLDQGGVEKMAVEYSNLFVNMGHDVNLYVIYKLKTDRFTLHPRVKTHKLFGFYFKGLDRIVSLIPYEKLYRLFKFGKADVEIAFQADLPTKIMSKSINTGALKIAWIHGIGMKYDKAYENFDKIVFVGDDVKNHYAGEFENIDSNKFEVIYNPINRDDIIRKSKEPTPEKFDSDTRKIISIGRLTKEKGFDRLIHAFNILVNDYGHNLELLIVGEGNEKDNLVKLIDSLDLNDKVHLLGFKKNPYSYLKQSFIYVCASNYEGYNVAMTEAGVLGKPIVSTPVYGTKDFLGDNSERGLISNFTKEDIAKDINILLKDDSLYQSISKNLIKKTDQIIIHQKQSIIELLSN